MLVDVVRVIVLLPAVHMLEFAAFIFFFTCPPQGFDTIKKWCVGGRKGSIG